MVDYYLPSFNLHLPDKLKRIQTVVTVGIDQAIANYKVLAAEDIKPAAEFIATCLRLDPLERPSACDLAAHPWLKGADSCVDYRKPILRD
jgi:serine/threonine protein kinase